MERVHSENPYLSEIEQTLPRLLSLFNQDVTSASYGMGDRYHWAWGLIDFGNGTFQGAAHGLSRLVASGLLPARFDERRILALIRGMFKAAKTLRRSDGSMEEAFPYEGSFCVTALVAYDLLSAVELLEERLTDVERRYCLGVVRPMIGFLERNDETHALISNHLATAVAALVKWSRLANEGNLDRALEILNRILKNQSSEGWFREYEGADPGYQSLATYYLADIHRMEPNLGLLEPLKRSVEFLWHFAHPDGSFGGIYGSRNTRFYYPAGIESLAECLPEAGALAEEMRTSIAGSRVVTLSCMDEPNLVPMFNAYAWAAVHPRTHTDAIIPCRAKPFRRHFDEAGLLIDRGKSHYSILSLSKGGVVYHFENEKARLIDCGVVIQARNGDQASTQNWSQHRTTVHEESVEIESDLLPMQRQETSPLKYLALRFLCLSVMRNSWIRERVKQLLVKLLITRRAAAVGTSRRRITLGQNLRITDETSESGGYKTLEKRYSFVAIHMASQGYWQQSDTGGGDH